MAKPTLPTPINPDAYASDKEVAQFLGLTPDFMRQQRCKGTGPAFAKFGRSVRYRWGTVIDYARQRSVTSTSEQVAA